MNIKIGKQYINKTWRFLVPSLQGHGTTFVNKFNPLFKLGVGIHDSYLDGAKITEGKNIYVLLDKKYRPRDFEKFMEYIRCQKFFKGEYCPDSEILSSRKHVIILEVPEIFYNSYDKFLQGKYSEMYNSEHLNLLFSSKNRKIDYEILSKTGKDALNQFKKSIDNEFNVESNLEDLEKGEWELPLKKTEEIFNCLDKDTVFFNDKIDKIWQ